MNVANLELSLVQKINNSTSTLDTLIYSKALQELKTGTVTTVDSFSGLPAATASLIGHLFYVKNEETFYYASLIEKEYRWITLRSDLINLYTWGYNTTAGMLGDGTTTARTSPGTVAGGGTTWCAVSMSKSACHTLAIKNDGTVWTWGLNNYGQLGDGTATNRSSPGTVSGGGTSWCAISAGGYHSLGLKTDGTLWTWGLNNAGQLGDGTLTSRSSPIQVSGGGNSWCSISAGLNYSIALKTDGSIWTWGDGSHGKLGNNSTSGRCSPGGVAGGLSDWSVISAGQGSSAGVTKSGLLYTWGCNTCGELGDGSVTSRLSPVTVAGGGSNWKCVATGGYQSTLGLKTDGTLWTWGRNAEGQLGNGTSGAGTERCSPGTVAGAGTTWRSIDNGRVFNIAAKTDGSIWTFGTEYARARSSPTTMLNPVVSWRMVSGGRCASASI